MAFLYMTTFVFNDRRNLLWAEEMQRSFAQHDSRMEARNAIGH